MSQGLLGGLMGRAMGGMLEGVAKQLQQQQQQVMHAVPSNAVPGVPNGSSSAVYDPELFFHVRA